MSYFSYHYISPYGLLNPQVIDIDILDIICVLTVINWLNRRITELQTTSQAQPTVRFPAGITTSTPCVGLTVGSHRTFEVHSYQNLKVCFYILNFL